jgi:DNA-binding winged helix-turn-helix (wHTH) protein
MKDLRSPFVLGKPIKDPADFYGREHELRELFESVVNMQPVALVGEHRCGNTSLLYQIQNEAVQARYLSPTTRDQLLLVFVTAQLAAEGPDAFYRRLARAMERADENAKADFDAPIDTFWIEDYLDDLTDRGMRLVLLLDEFEVMSSFESGFWEWFRGLITEYDLSIVVATRVELGSFRDEWGVGSPFFNMFRAIYIGSFSPADIELFFQGVGERTGVDFTPMKPLILALAGRFPYFLQVATALCHELAQREPLAATPDQIAFIEQEFRVRTEAHFEDIWQRLPDSERDGMAWLAVGARPEGREGLGFQQALPVLERRGYLVDGQIFSTMFADYVRHQTQRIELNPETGEVRIEKRAVDLPPKEFSLLRFLMDSASEVVSKDEIAAAVWPEYTHDTLGVTDAMIQKTISRLRKEVDVTGTAFQHIESVRGQGYRFQNASVYEFYHHAGEPEPAGETH